MNLKLFILVTGLVAFMVSCAPKTEIQVEEIKTVCDRACLENYVNTFIDAVVARDPSKASLAAEVIYTENGQRLVPGDGMWATANERGTFKLYVSDPESGQVGFIGTIRENGIPAILGLRLKIENMEITEAEAFVARDKKEASMLDSIGAPNPVFLESIPVEERISRDSLKVIANMYFTGLQRNDGKGVYPFTDNCNRIENGHFTTNNPKRGAIEGMSPLQQFQSGFFAFVTRIRDRRFPIVDEERGIVYALAFFDHAGTVPEITLTSGVKFPMSVLQPFTYQISEAFKIEKGKFREIQALYREAPYGMGSGWTEWEQAISSEPIY
jgi:hypothetical protein